jgi:hypothetical protein
VGVNLANGIAAFLLSIVVPNSSLLASSEDENRDLHISLFKNKAGEKRERERENKKATLSRRCRRRIEIIWCCMQIDESDSAERVPAGQSKINYAARDHEYGKKGSTPSERASASAFP